MGSATADPRTESTSEPSPSNADGPSETSLDRNEVFDVLSNERRRYALHYLKQQDDGTANMRELSRQVAAWENGKPAAEVTSDERKRAYTALHQTHLPRMDEMGVVEYESRDDSIEISEEGSEIEIYYDVVQGGDIPWSHFYLGLSGLALGAVVATAVGLLPFKLVPGIALAGGLAVGFGITAAVHAYRNREAKFGVEGPPPEIEER